MAERAPLRACCLLFVPLLLGACATNPVTGERDFAILTEAQELQLGQQSHAQLIAQFGRYEDPELEAYVARIGQQIVAVSHRPNIPYEFYILDTDEVNAFATPGYVYVTRGILALFSTEAELAAVLGHEVAHITARHGVRQLSQHAIAELALDALTSGSGATAQYAGEMVKTAYVTGYGRKNELEADELGVGYASAIGYEPRAMLTMFERLSEYGKYVGAHGVHGLFSTHPPWDARHDVAERAARGARGSQIGRTEYLAQIDGLRLGQDSDAGIISDGWFFYPPLGFALEVPEGTTAHNTPDMLELTAADGHSVTVVLAEIKSWASACELVGEEAGVTLAPRPYSAVSDVCAGHTREGTLAVLDYPPEHVLVFQSAGAGSGMLRRTVNSVRAMTGAELMAMRERQIELATATAGDTYVSYARGAGMEAETAEYLRLVNDDWPEGEPTPGDAVKTVTYTRGLK